MLTPSSIRPHIHWHATGVEHLSESSGQTVFAYRLVRCLVTQCHVSGKILSFSSCSYPCYPSLLSGPGSHSFFSRAPAPTPSSLGPRLLLHLLLGSRLGDSIFFQAPARTQTLGPRLQLSSARSNPRFSPSLHSVYLCYIEYLSLQFHRQQEDIPSNVIIMY